MFKKIEVDRGAAVQAHACRSSDAGAQQSHSSQRWNYRAAPERLMAQQLLFSRSRIYAWRSGNSIYNHHSYAEDFSFKQLGQRLCKKPFSSSSSSFLWERRRGSCNHHLFTVTRVQIKMEGRKGIRDEFHPGWFFLTLLEVCCHSQSKSKISCFDSLFGKLVVLLSQISPRNDESPVCFWRNRKTNQWRQLQVTVVWPEQGKKNCFLAALKH